MTAAEALAALRAHLAKKGFGDIEVRMTGGYDPNSTPADAALIRVETEVYRQGGIDPVILPRSAGSWPGYVFTGEPLHLAAGPFGLGHGSGAHAPDEYYLVESKKPESPRHGWRRSLVRRASVRAGTGKLKRLPAPRIKPILSLRAARLVSIQ